MHKVLFFLISFLVSCNTITNNDSSSPNGDNTAQPPIDNLKPNEWVYLGGDQNISPRTVNFESLHVPQNNRPIIAFSAGGKIIVHRWNTTSWDKLGEFTAHGSASSLVTINNQPYLAYEKIADTLEIITYINNSWQSLPTIANVQSYTLYTHQNTLYLAYINTSRKLFVKTYQNNTWTDFGDTSALGEVSSSVVHGPLMLYHNNFYIVVRSFFSGNPLVLTKNGNKWAVTPALNPPIKASINSDDYFLADSKGNFYYGYLEGVHTATGKLHLFKYHNNAWISATPLPNGVFGYQIALHNDELYSAYSHSPNDIFNVADKVKVTELNDSLNFVPNTDIIVSDDNSTGSNVKMQIKDNYIYVMYLDKVKSHIVVKMSILQ